MRCSQEKCKQALPVQYVHGYQDHPPFFVQVFGWSQVGKTIFLAALTFMLRQMTNVWPRYTCTAATDASQRKLQEIDVYMATGQLPEITPMGIQEAYIMPLNNMPLWGGRTLVTRDCAGEIFESMEIPVEQAPYLLHVPTTFMFISLPDLRRTGGRSMDMLLNNYIETMLRHDIDFKKAPRNLIVVFTKADLLDDLPAHLRRYLEDDPLWAAVNQAQPMDEYAMEEYLESMGRVSEAIRRWIQQDVPGKTFVRSAEDRNIDLRFALISSTGKAVHADNTTLEALEPRRVLDPCFWALELQSSR